jgi:diaminopimelate epimerase
MEFVKMAALGNDFIVVTEAVELDRSTVAAWCERRTGIGADGVLMVTPEDGNRVRMRYWNADGNEAEMCGNGLRCVALLAWERGWVSDREFIVETAVGPRPVHVKENGSVKALLGEPHEHRVAALTVAGQAVTPVGIGNPHAVLFVPDPEEADVANIGARIERDPIFPGGANVEFAAVRPDNVIDLRVWERGVGETLACGTGAAAAAYAAYRLGEVGARTTVRQPGGDLIVEFDEEGAWLEGPAGIVYAGTIV